MAVNGNTIISIKRSQTTDNPPSLANGELAYSFSSNKLFIGQTTTSGSPVTVEYIGGKLIVDKVANLEQSIVSGGGNFNLDTMIANVITTNTLKFDGFPEYGLLFTNANSAVRFVQTTSEGKILQVSANGAPVFDDLNGGTF